MNTEALFEKGFWFYFLCTLTFASKSAKNLNATRVAQSSIKITTSKVTSIGF